MRGKPPIDQFTQRKDPSDFLEGGAADRAEKPVYSVPPKQPLAFVEAVKPEPTVQKLFRLRWDTANALKLGAAQESAAQGKRVTETEIIEALLREHYKLAS